MEPDMWMLWDHWLPDGGDYISGWFSLTPAQRAAYRNGIIEQHERVSLLQVFDLRTYQ